MQPRIDDGTDGREPTPALRPLKVSIRRATAADAELLADLARKIFIDTFGPQNTPENIALHVARMYAPDIQRRELNSESKTYLVAEVDGQAAGFAMLGDCESGSCREFDAPIELFRFYIDKPWHGFGIAQPLMDACDEEARARGGRTLCLSVWEHNSRARRFYDKIGFRDAGAQSFLLGEDIQTDRVMVRELVATGTR